MDIKLGSIQTDQVTGFTGRVMARCMYLTGCTQYLLSRTKLGKNDIPDGGGTWFDESRLIKEMWKELLAVEGQPTGLGGPTDGKPTANHP